MARFRGLIGYAKEVEGNPGVIEEEFIERKASGDLRRNTRRLVPTDQVHDKITTSNELSIVADAFANDNFYNIRYVIYKGVKLKVTNIDVQHPRLILSLGGVYNAE